MVVLVSATLLEYMGSGPRWPFLTLYFQKNCQENWWSTLLYVQNYVNPQKMVSTGTTFAKLRNFIVVCGAIMVHQCRHAAVSNFTFVILYLVEVPESRLNSSISVCFNIDQYFVLRNMEQPLAGVYLWYVWVSMH